jgi:uracil-DNA glycosylase family protein
MPMPKRSGPRGEESKPRTLDECRRCDLWRGATQAVGGSGPESARIVLLGEQPGNDEDLQGVPFVGPAGRLLDQALLSAELDRRTVYVTNAVKHFKYELRGKRRMHKTPAQREVEACLYWLERELDRIDPKVIVTLGITALRAVHPDWGGTLTSALGRVIDLGGRWLIPTYHPSYMLRLRDETERKQVLDHIIGALVEARRLAGEG